MAAVLVFWALFLCAPSAVFAARARSDSGLPIPRFVSLKAAEVNVRSGPGTRYPIVWVYRRERLPVEVVEEFDYWRKIRDVEGASGWVHKQMLDGARTVLTLPGMHTLYAQPDTSAKPQMKAEGGVVGALLECSLQWCRVQISGRKAWIARRALYGLARDEIYAP